MATTAEITAQLKILKTEKESLEAEISAVEIEIARLEDLQSDILNGHEAEYTRLLVILPLIQESGTTIVGKILELQQIIFETALADAEQDLIDTLAGNAPPNVQSPVIGWIEQAEQNVAYAEAVLSDARGGAHIFPEYQEASDIYNDSLIELEAERDEIFLLFSPGEIQALEEIQILIDGFEARL